MDIIYYIHKSVELLFQILGLVEVWTHRSMDVCVQIRRKKCGRNRNRVLQQYRWCTVKPALLTSSFEWQVQLTILQLSLFKVIKRKYFSQGKCLFLMLLYFSIMLFLTTFRNSSAISRPTLENMAEKMLKYFLTLNLITLN